jgi:endoglucanase
MTPAARSGDLIDARARDEHVRWLRELTSLPTAAGHEDAVVAWVERWVGARPRLNVRRDRAGNLIITLARPGRAASARKPAPIFITAHLDHPAFVVVESRGDEVVLEFRGGVHDPYFEDATIEIRDRAGRVHPARVVSLDPGAEPFKRVIVRVTERASAIVAGDLGRWCFAGDDVPRVDDGLLHAHACDDLAGVAAALAALDHLSGLTPVAPVGVLFTRAEEVGFIGAIAACQLESVPAKARLICLETSRSFAESPIGAGPIVRVGDRTSVFDRDLTNAIGATMVAHERARPGFQWQRKLMPGGTCEATTFGAYGYQATCLCLPLGNYHNMIDIDDVLAGRRPARVGPEFISLEDFHGLVEMLTVCATRLDAAVPSLQARMYTFMCAYGHVIGGAPPRRRGRSTRAAARRVPTRRRPKARAQK